MTSLCIKEIDLKEVFDLSLNISYSHLKPFETTIIYQSAFLSFLKMSSYIDEEVNKKMNVLYEFFKEDTFINSCIKKIKSNSSYLALCKDDSYVFLLLFSYDYFEEFYKCLCEFYNNGVISTQNQINFLNSIQT